MVRLEDMRFHGGIHTMEVVLYDVPLDAAVNVPGISSTEKGKHLFVQSGVQTDTGEICTFVDAKVNVNRYVSERSLHGREYWIESFGEFTEEFKCCIDQIPHSRFEIIRVDFRIDEYTHVFQEMLKWNRVLLEVLREPWMLEHIENIKGQTIRTQCKNKFGRCIQVYDKPAEEKHRSQIVKTRFEIQDVIRGDEVFSDIGLVRHRGINYVVYSLEHLKYIPTLDESIKNAEQREAKAIVRGINKKIEKEQSIGLSLKKSDLIRSYRDRIFSACELSLICKGLGMESQTAYKYGSRYKLNEGYLSKEGIISYGRMLGEALDEFLSN